MAKLKLGMIADDKPVKATIELPAALHQDLIAYAAELGRQSGRTIADPIKLIVPMLERFIATDRGFAKARKENQQPTARRTVTHVVASVASTHEVNTVALPERVDRAEG